MDFKSILSCISENYPKQLRKNLIKELLSRSKSKPCRIQQLDNSIFQGTFAKFSKGKSIEITSNHQRNNISLTSLIFFILRYQVKSVKTDSEISKQKQARRKLQEWITDGPEICLEQGDRNWDQFELNKIEYGVISTYDEELYTTKKVIESELSKEQVKRAMKLEKEILFRNRKFSADQDEDDEEKMYGAVLNSGRYANNIQVSDEICMNKDLENLDKKTGIESVKEENKEVEVKNEDDKRGFGIKRELLKVVTDDDVDIKLMKTPGTKIIEEENYKECKKDIIDFFFEDWKNSARDIGFQEW
ncbi:hypothetical protein SteCoe_14358 [Stentor coeruleus]|uniref:LsmAD domain-containing protein n=1 Tax=Stentor coeruleus TaxID=5963 RepID=A0A1R2C6A7_9CILI|nr:hypothetical protein SteCoe_14358 [Stentor coeruleus]